MSRPAILLTALLVAGCTGSGGNTGSAQPSFVTEVSPSSVAVTPTSAAPPKASSAAPPPSKPSYPAAADAYAKAVVAAWVAKDQTRLADLTDAQTHEQLIEIPGPINMAWTFLMCDGAAGSTYCRFRNTPGDVIILRVTNSKLGTAHAAVEVRLHPKA